jgi:hypothetical protein
MLNEILSKLSGKPAKERLDERCLGYLRDHVVPRDLISALEACAYAGPIRIGPAWLSRVAEIDRENTEEENAACMAGGFLIVGSGLNGDPIAFELSSRKMAFISHDILWERSYDNFEECVVRTPLGFDEFWAEAAASPDFPRDSYDAEKRWGPSPDAGDCAG